MVGARADGGKRWTAAAPVTLYAAVAGSIVVERLEKRYGQRRALAGVSFSVGAGEIVGLLGPNGAGKSTTLSILATRSRPTKARSRSPAIRFPRGARGAPRARLRAAADALYPTLTARENLRFFGRMPGLGAPRRGGAAARAGARGARRSRRRADCRFLRRHAPPPEPRHAASSTDPRVLLLDEPTAGVDPQSRERIFDAIAELAADGAAVLYSTHDMEEAERLCGRIVLLDAGRVVAAGTPERAGRGARPRPSFALRTLRSAARRLAVVATVGAAPRATGTRVRARGQATADVLPVLLAAERAGGEIEELRLDARPSPTCSSRSPATPSATTPSGEP